MITIINAACRHPHTGSISAAPTHAEAWLHMFPGWTIEQIAAHTRFDIDTSLEGFITSEGQFVSRHEALLIALAARQTTLRGGMLCRNESGQTILIAESTTYQPAA